MKSISLSYSDDLPKRKMRGMTPLTDSQTFAPTPVSQTFGKYLLFERIGVGGMAEVFRAVVLGPENFQRTLVIKRILPHLSENLSFVRMFIDEAKVSGLLSHPNLVQIFEFGKIGPSFFIAMEHVQGRTLAATMKLARQTGREFPVAAATEIARQLCTGLEYAHTLRSAEGQPLGIVHRDVTPSNLMLSFHGVAKILDFGIARVADGLRQTQTQVGSLKGKISYMSPEQIQLHPVDHRSDLFSLGIVMHEMLTGRRLFRADSDIRAGRLVLELEIPVPSACNPAVPPALDRIVMQALARDVESRYQTAGAMAADLEQVMMDERLSPREHERLLHQLFPHEVMAAADAGVIVPPLAATEPQASERVTPRKDVDAVQIFSAISASDGLPGSGAAGSTVATGGEVDAPAGHLVPARIAWGKRLAIGALVLVATVSALTVLAKVRRPGSSATDPHPATTTVTVAKTMPPISIRCSLDSTPQDADIIRVDSGAVMGRTPLTIELPQSRTAVAFRLEKSGYGSIVYRIIPDLDKSVRVDLLRSPAREQTLSATHAPRPTESSSRAPHRRSTRTEASMRSANASPDASKPIHRAVPVNPFDM